MVSHLQKSKLMNEYVSQSWHCCAGNRISNRLRLKWGCEVSVIH